MLRSFRTCSVATLLAGIAVAQPQLEGPVKLAEVVVTPSKFAVAQENTTAGATLTAEQLEVLPQLGDDLYRSIARLPGLAADDFTAKFWVRGAPNREVLARFDGVDLLEPFHLKDVDGALSIVDPAIINRLELVTGGFTAEYGDRLAGVLTMETKTPTRPQTMLGLSLTGVGGTQAGVFAQNRGRWLVSARRGYPDIALKAAGRDDDITPRYYDLSGNLEYDLTPAQTVSVHVLHAGDTLRYERKNDPSLRSAYDSDYVWTRWRGTVGEKLTGEAVASMAWLTWERNGSGRMDGFPFSLRDHRRMEQAAVRNDWTLAVNDRLVARMGLEGRTGFARYNYSMRRSYSSVVGDRQVVSGEVRDTTAKPSRDTVGGYATMRVQPLPSLVVEPGLRVDRQNRATPPRFSRVSPAEGQAKALKSEASPRLNAVLTLGRATLRAAWGRYSQAKDLHELDIAQGDTGYGWREHATQSVISLEYPVAKSIALRVEGYERVHTDVSPRWENLDNPYDLFPEVQDDRQWLDVDRGRARGVEVIMSSRGPAHVAWRASYAFARAEERVWSSIPHLSPFPSQDISRWVPRSRDQRHTFYADATYSPNPRWQFSAAWQFHTGWPTTDVVYSLAPLANGRRVIVSANGPVYGLRLPDYHRLDLRATRRWKFSRSELRAFLDIFNAYDRVNIIGYDHSVTLSGTQITDRRKPREQLPFLPSIGITWTR